jgi:predicted RNase H-like HicB family nuclease
MTTVTVRYYSREGYWHAECSEVPELVAGDRDLDAVVSLAHEAIRDFLDDPELGIRDEITHITSQSVPPR